MSTAPLQRLRQARLCLVGAHTKMSVLDAESVASAQRDVMSAIALLREASRTVDQMIDLTYFVPTASERSDGVMEQLRRLLRRL